MSRPHHSSPYGRTRGSKLYSLNTVPTWFMSSDELAVRLHAPVVNILLAFSATLVRNCVTVLNQPKVLKSLRSEFPSLKKNVLTLTRLNVNHNFLLSVSYSCIQMQLPLLVVCTKLTVLC